MMYRTVFQKDFCWFCLLYSSHLEYVVDERTYMRMQFYVSGSRRKGKAHIDLKKVTYPFSSCIVYVVQ